MRAVIFLVVTLNATGAVAQHGNAPPPATQTPATLRERIESHLRSVSRSAVELAFLGRPVKAESCRIFDRGKGQWRSLYADGEAVHVRYRTRDRFGSPVVHSKVVFLGEDGQVLGAVETGGVRSNDPALLQ